jgi:hypothetical protein
MRATDHPLGGAHAPPAHGSAPGARSDKAGDWSKGRSEEPIFSDGFATGHASEVFRSQPHACTASFPTRRPPNPPRGRGTSHQHRCDVPLRLMLVPINGLTEDTARSGERLAFAGTPFVVARRLNTAAAQPLPHSHANSMGKGAVSAFPSAAVIDSDLLPIDRATAHLRARLAVAAAAITNITSVASNSAHHQFTGSAS